MKKLLFSAHNLDLGGIETTLATLVNYLSEQEYEITIALEKKEGVFLERLSKKIKIIEYNTNNNKNIIIRKLCNLYNRIKFIIKYKNKFDFSASFATYSIPSSFMARIASKNSALWGHSDYLAVYHGNIEKVKEFFKNVYVQKFKHIVFVTQKGEDTFLKIFPELKEKVILCHNLVDSKNILEKAEQPVEDIKKEYTTTFLNVSRHEEEAKKITRIIEASKKLKEESYKFQVWMVGDGQDTDLYKQKVKENNLEDTILFLGKKENPYPYFKMSDCVILSSEYEGYPVVYLESFVLNKPIITTKVSDYEQVEDGRGIVVEKSTEAIYTAMKKFIQNGYKIEKPFDDKAYNQEILKTLETIF